MMRLLKLPILFVTVITLLISSCHKDDPAPKTKRDLLMQHTWDIKSLAPTTSRNDYLLRVGFECSFRSDGHYYIVSKAGNESGTWVLSSDEQQIIFGAPSKYLLTSEILSLNESILALRSINNSTMSWVFQRKGF